MNAVLPYLTFNGNCEAAFDFYHSVFGGPALQKMRFKDQPSDKPLSPETAEKIMHVQMPIAEGFFLFGSDSSEDFGGTTVKVGNNISLSINAESEAEADRLFNGLSASGIITMPMQRTFWNAYFGMFTDQFGIQWQINYDYPQSK